MSESALGTPDEIREAVRERYAEAASTGSCCSPSGEAELNEGETFGEAGMRQIRVKGLVALSIPGMHGAPAPDPPNTVNVLRHVFNKLFGTRYPMLRSASYPEGNYPYQWEEMRVR